MFCCRVARKRSWITGAEFDSVLQKPWILNLEHNYWGIGIAVTVADGKSQ